MQVTRPSLFNVLRLFGGPMIHALVYSRPVRVDLEPKLGESTANDVSTYMNWTCPRILYFDDFGPRAQRNLPFFFPSFFHISHDLLASYDWLAPSIGFPPFFFTGAPWPSVGAPVHWWVHWCTFFSKGTPLRSVGAPFSTGGPSHFILFFHNSCIRPPPFFSLLLTTMPPGSRSVTTSLDCVGTPAVAVLCESDCPSSACVVQSERKKKKRVSVIVGNRKVPKKSDN
jgi:hypothetical protein